MPGLLPLSEYSSLVSLSTLFTPPPIPTGTAAAAALDSALSHLWGDYRGRNGQRAAAHEITQLDLTQKIKLFHQLLTVREPHPPLPEGVLADIEGTLRYINHKKVLTPVASLPVVLPARPEIALWRGDITALGGVTAIVNAANERMLGCFAPGHLCIDNVIHYAAGPRLRDDCAKIMGKQGQLEPNGKVKVTRGYLLPARYVLHTAGPKVPKRPEGVPRVSEAEKAELEGSYRSCLEVMEKLQVQEGESKSVAFCCVSTGVFGYPPEEAVNVAVDTVLAYLGENPVTSIDRVIFNVFTATDLSFYIDKLNSLLPTPTITPALLIPPTTTSPSLELAAKWLKSAPNLLITAGAGLSASDGLDFTSHDLLRKNFPGMWEQGFTCLYDFFGYDKWESPAAKWGYYFSHLIFARDWTPPCGVDNSVYTQLRKLITALYGEGGEKSANVFVRTSNADGQFFRYGFSAERIATPQGTYELLQCMRKCQPHAYWPAQEFIDKAMPYLDTVACALRQDIEGWEDVIPRCRLCAGEMFLCVRGGSFFTEVPFEASNRRYLEFKRHALNEGLVVLEMGAGFNTPGVIRWEDEKLATVGGGRVKLVRVGLGGSEEVDWDLEGDGRAVGIDGDAGKIARSLVELLAAE
ncbi:putative phosphatase like proteins to the carbon terminal domain of histone macroH2A1 [Morchella snyderi]|nr:putative phosphatase like proteins to the carbon terminal domain of histone macroH2A1 [Morchella snyderi]